MASVRDEALNHNSDQAKKEAVIRDAFKLLPDAEIKIHYQVREVCHLLEIKSLEDKVPDLKATDREDLLGKKTALLSLKTYIKNLCSALQVDKLEALKAKPPEFKLDNNLVEKIRNILYGILLIEEKKPTSANREFCKELTDTLIKMARCWPHGLDEEKGITCAYLNNFITPGREVYTAAGNVFDIEMLAADLQRNNNLNCCNRKSFSRRELETFAMRGRELNVAINQQPNQEVRRDILVREGNAHLLQTQGFNLLPRFSQLSQLQAQPLHVRMVTGFFMLFPIVGAMLAIVTLYYLPFSTHSLLPSFNIISSYSGLIVAGVCGLWEAFNNPQRVKEFFGGFFVGAFGAVTMFSTLYAVTSLLSLWIPSVAATWAAYQMFAPALFIVSALFNKGMLGAIRSLLIPVAVLGAGIGLAVGVCVGVVASELVSFGIKLKNLFCGERVAPAAPLAPVPPVLVVPAPQLGQGNAEIMHAFEANRRELEINQHLPNHLLEDDEEGLAAALAASAAEADARAASHPSNTLRLPTAPVGGLMAGGAAASAASAAAQSNNAVSTRQNIAGPAR